MFKPGDVLRNSSDIIELTVVNNLPNLFSSERSYTVRINSTNSLYFATERMLVNTGYKVVKPFSGSIEFDIS